jgi:Arc/MetJ-type ribon-helix-helix transcriptional regulator
MMMYHTDVPVTKVAVTIDAHLLREVDAWVAAGEFPNRSRAVQAALDRLRAERGRRASLLAELAKLDLDEERALAEERLVGEAPWSGS